MAKQKNMGKLFTDSEISAFCSQLALILKSGLSPYEGVTAMLEDALLEEEKKILTCLSEKLAMGEDLSHSLEEQQLFPSYMIEMVKIGEQTGRLDDVMELLAAHYQREDFISRSIKNAITYPLVMASVMILVIVVLLVKVLPIFNQVFIQLGSEMTGLSAVLMKIGLTLNRYSVVFVSLILLLAVCLLFFFKAPGGKKLFNSFCYRFPFSRSLLEDTCACRFASGLALTLGSGLGSEQGLLMVQAVNQNPYFEKKIQECLHYLEEGTDLSSSLQKAHIFSGIHSRIITIGEKTGALDKAMNDVASRYQDTIDFRISRALSIIEPTLVISISLIVGIILFSVMLPLIGIMSGM
ncbi:MAG: type II secretion system F family protein [Lachnospiraceae bacterium]|nr:type II secretion system F family protein [Lachnospiraceae bacterium]